MTYKRLTALLLALCLLLGLFAACGKSDGDTEDSTQPSTQPTEEKKDYGEIGEMDGVQYDEKYGDLITPYARLAISLQEESESFSYSDGSDKTFQSSPSQITTDFSDTKAKVTQNWDGNTELTTTFTAQADGSMDIVQSMYAKEGGISDVSFRITVPMKYSVIIPAWDGICLNEEHPEIYDKRTYLAYPREWQAQMFLIQGTNGGVLVHARDAGTQFKGLNITNDGENFYLDVHTIPQAPFTDYSNFETVTWSVIPYKGDWIDGTLLYKAYSNETFRLDEAAVTQPDWVDDIALVWMDDIDSLEKLDLLAQQVDPTKVLIQVPGWRAYEYDTNYPDYEPADGLKEKIDYAHALGFKVSLHCNMIGCSFSSNEWEEGLSEFACLDAYTRETIVEGYTAFGKDYRFGQMNQASVEWQDIMVERMVQVVKDTGADCIHLDQSLLCFNDGRGLVNGMTTMQGNIELQRRLAEALPGIAFSGEGINEFNMVYADFLQQHVYGLDSNADVWSDAYFQQILPVTTVLYAEYTDIYHYPALTTADEEYEEQFLAWYRAGNMRSGTLPCLYRESVASFDEPTESFKLIMEDARFYAEHNPIINTDHWSDKAIMSYVLNDGTVAEWIETDEDIKFYPNIAEENFTTVFVHNVTSYETDRSLPGWVLYDSESLHGLREDTTYYLTSTPRDDNATHITSLEDNLTTRGFISNPEYTAIAFDEVVPSNKIEIDLLAYDGEMRAGEVLFDGKTDSSGTFNSMQSFWYTFSDQGQVRHMGDRLMFHPPWVDEIIDLGYSWYEVDVPLEVVGNATFSASFQLASAESAAGSDGVVFKVYAWAEGDKSDMETAEIFCTTAIALPLSLDLTRFEGKTVTIRIECYTGGTPRNDSCHVVAPMVEQMTGKVSREITYTVKTHDAVTGILSLLGSATMEDLGDQNYAITANISDTVWLLHAPKAISDETDMTVYPGMAAWLMDSGESIAPTGDLAPQQQVAESNYELRNGIFQHPPQTGTSQYSWLITLPEKGSAHFDTAIAMKTGSGMSDGVTFRILINGQEVFSQAKAGASGYEDVSIDLSDYRGQTIILTLCVDSGAGSAYDYAFWGDPLIYTR